MPPGSERGRRGALRCGSAAAAGLGRDVLPCGVWPSGHKVPQALRALPWFSLPTRPAIFREILQISLCSVLTREGGLSQVPSSGAESCFQQFLFPYIFKALPIPGPRGIFLCSQHLMNTKRKMALGRCCSFLGEWLADGFIKIMNKNDHKFFLR